MTEEQDVNLFENTLLSKTKELIIKEFGLADKNAHRYFHYTSNKSYRKIITSQIFNASFIRSTSDSLEFSLPLSICRDWICFGNTFLKFSKFPTNLFKHFNEQAIDPSVRYYFISVSTNNNSEHLKSIYGKNIIEFDLKNFPDSLDSFGLIYKCKYIKNADYRSEVITLLEKWRDIFDAAIMECKISNAENLMSTWFYIFMQFCHAISLSIKQEPFKDEEEIRLLVVCNADLKTETEWHKRKISTRISKQTLLRREALPLKINNLGIKISGIHCEVK